MPTPRSATASPAAFFALTFLLSAPFYLLHTLAYLEILGDPETGMVYIVLFTVAPILAASILTLRHQGKTGLRRLLGRVFDVRRIAGARWHLALLLPVVILLLAIAAMAVFPGPMPPALVPMIAAPAALVLFFVMAAGEEVGWMGYAFQPMQAHRGALRAAVLLGLLWALWHVPFFVFVMPNRTALFAQLLTLVGTRVLLAWIFNNTGNSVFAATMFHAIDNTALMVLPDVNEMGHVGPIVLCGVVCLAAVIVTWPWGPRTLADFRLADAKR